MPLKQKDIILHIGTHKTGSTAIQLYLYKNQEHLKKKNILYPKIGCPDFARFGQHYLAWSCLESDDYLPVYKGKKQSRSAIRAMNLWAQLDGLPSTDNSSRIVLSSEEFSVLGEDGVECVHQELAGHNVTVVIYLRRQDDFLESAYGTSVIYNAEKRNFYDFSKEQRTNLNYFEMVSLWGKHFGQANIVVRSYEDAAIRKNVIKDFLRVSGLLSDSLPEPEDDRVNASISAHLIEVIRGLRLRGWPEEKLDGLRRVAMAIQPNGVNGSRTSFMNNEYRQSLYDLFEESNRNLRDVYGCDLTIADVDINHTSVVQDFCDSLVWVMSEIQDRGGFIEA